MRILFLDIDGVLCTRRSHLVYGKEGGMWYNWDPLGCAAISKACAKGVQIVVSSTWRHPAHRDDLFAQLALHDLFKYLVQPDWLTPDLIRGRGHDIDAYLREHAGIEHYKILDDDSDMLEYQLPHFIHTDGEEGMTADNIKKLLNWAGALKS